jgi:putative tryptophan/tyrosine transport system substrate-binding protein
MRRREFITLIAGAVIGERPLAARAQQPDRMRRIGVYTFGAESDPSAQAYARALRQGLEQLGWIEGRNMRVDYRWTSGDRLKAEVAEMVDLAPDLIVCGGTQLSVEFKQKTQTIPIVFVQVADPVASGLVESLARPAGNITGFTAYAQPSMGEKWLELLKEITPRLTQVLVLVDPQNPTWMTHVPTMEKVALSFAVQLTVVHARNPAEIARAIEAFAARPNAGLIVLPSLMTVSQRELITTLAAKHRMPAVYAIRDFVTSGGLAYYGPDWVDLYRRAASYVDLILKGAKPADLPVQQPTKFALGINLKTAKALDLEVPPTLLARADEVIE